MKRQEHFDKYKELHYYAPKKILMKPPIDWRPLISDIKPFAVGDGCNWGLIAQYERDLNVRFDASYRSFMAQVGFIAWNGVIVYGVCQDDHLVIEKSDCDTKSSTLNHRAIYGPLFPEGAYVVATDYIALSTGRVVPWPAEPGYFDPGFRDFEEFFRFLLNR